MYITDNISLMYSEFASIQFIVISAAFAIYCNFSRLAWKVEYIVFSST